MKIVEHHVDHCGELTNITQDGEIPIIDDGKLCRVMTTSMNMYRTINRYILFVVMHSMYYSILNNLWLFSKYWRDWLAVHNNQ